MPVFLGMLANLVAYIVGLVLIVRMTPKLLFRAYDDVWFMVFAVLDVLGALLTFGSILFSLGMFNNVGIRTLAFVLLAIVIFITGSLALSCFRNGTRGIQPLSRYGAVLFCLFLSVAALFSIVQLFKA